MPDQTPKVHRARPGKARRDRAYREANVHSAVDHLAGLEEAYDVIVIGSGLAGMTGANCLAKQGRKVLLLEQHYILGGLAQWFKRSGNHIFDISLHGFPVGMKKTLRKYWSAELADNIHQVKSVRFDNPQFTLDTTFDREDFTRILIERFGIAPERVQGFYDHLAAMNYYDNDRRCTRDLFQEFFPGRHDVWRLLMEPISYANGSTLDDPAISYGIVFSNFMSKGVYIYHGGTDDMVAKMQAIMEANGVTIRTKTLVQKILIEQGRATGVLVNGRTIRAKAVLSNAGLHPTIKKLAGEENFSPDFLREFAAVRPNSSSCQVYIGIRKGESIPFIGDLIFTSTHPEYDSQALVSRDISSRTFSVYYPEMRPGRGERYTIVCSINSQYQDFASLGDEEYQQLKDRIIDETLVVLEKYCPGIGAKIDYLEAATPRTVGYYILSENGTSFGTKFEGLKISQELPAQVKGLFHAGSVGIIMSGWLGAANYGVITANAVDKYLHGTTL